MSYLKATAPQTMQLGIKHRDLLGLERKLENPSNPWGSKTLFHVRILQNILENISKHSAFLRALCRGYHDFYVRLNVVNEPTVRVRDMALHTLCFLSH